MSVRPALALAALLLGGCVGPLIEVQEAPPRDLVVGFSWSPEPPRVGQAVSFTADINSRYEGDSLVRLAWRFGDGDASPEHLARHVYTAPGAYEVKLQVETSLAGVASATKTIFVKEAPAGTLPASPAPAGPVLPPEAESDPPTILAEVDANVVRLGYEWSLVPRSIRWEFHDGLLLTDAQATRSFYEVGDFEVRLLLIADDGDWGEAFTTVAITQVPFLPHVIVGVPDTGINPYHDIYSRPELTAHPCTYIRGFPCGIPALNLSLEETEWSAAFAKDRAKWEAIRPGDIFWIPRTVFVAVICESIHLESDPSQDLCILDDSHMHGTGTTSSILMENPGALIAFKETNGGVAAFQAHGIPVDVYSVSWGYSAPVPVLPGYAALPAIYVKSAGNDPRSTFIDGWAGQPEVISVGGAYAASDSEEAMATKQPEIVSYYCRPTAQTRSLSAMRESYCGTSFAAPTAAGALSKVILGLREASGYTGTISGGFVDPLSGITVADLRQAMNLTASYDPEAQYPNSSVTGIPRNSVAPWLQWGWGFYDGLVADATLAHLRDGAPASKPAEAVTYMETQMAAKEATHPV